MSMLKITQDTLVEKHNGKKSIVLDQYNCNPSLVRSNKKAPAIANKCF